MAEENGALARGGTCGHRRGNSQNHSVAASNDQHQEISEQAVRFVTDIPFVMQAVADQEFEPTQPRLRKHCYKIPEDEDEAPLTPEETEELWNLPNIDCHRSLRKQIEAYRKMRELGEPDRTQRKAP